MNNNYKFGNGSLANLENVDENLVELCHLALKFSTVDISIIEGHRTQERQKMLYAEGKSELDGIVKMSDHQASPSKAVDIIPYVKGVDIWDVDNPKIVKLWFEVGRAMLRAAMKLGLAVEWGVAYNIGGGRDYPHFSVLGKLN